MTNPPTDEELAAIWHRAPGPANEPVAKAGNRALFQAGERRGIERAIDAIRCDGMRHSERAIYVLESIGVEPAVEENLDTETARPHGLADWLSIDADARRGKEHCAEAPALLEDEPPAKPEAAGEEPAIVRRLRGMHRRGVRFTLDVDAGEIRELVEWLDRPAPAAKEAMPLNRESFHLTYNGGWQSDREIEAFHHGMDTVFNALESQQPVEAAKEAGELTPGERALVERIETLCLKAWEHEASQLRAKVQDFEAWALNTARQSGWEGESAFDAFEHLNSGHERLKEERDRLRARVAEIEHIAESRRAELAETDVMLKRNQHALQRLAAHPALSERIVAAQHVASVADLAGEVLTELQSELAVKG